MADACARAGVPTALLPEGLRLRRRGSLTFAFNCGPDPQALPATPTKLLLGANPLPPSGVAAWT